MDKRPDCAMNRLIDEYDMLPPGCTVVCAVSGGADSVCMLHVLLSLRNTLGITVEAAHFNHQLRGEESDRDEAFVRTRCAELGVVLHVDNGDVRARAAKTHESVEEAARALRYTFFSSLPGLIATAHTQDDNLETVLLNLTRGTGLAGLCGIPPRRERFIRPMLAVSRAEIEAYLAQNGLSHVTDSTNFLPDARRNRLRQSVIPLLKAENPSLCETAFRMCRLLEADEAQKIAQLLNGHGRFLSRNKTQVFLDTYRDIITSFSLVVNVILLTRMAKHFCHSGTKHEEKEEKGTLLWKRSPAKAF